MKEFLALAYLFLPLLVGLALHGFCIKYDILAFLRRPIDRGRSFRGKRIFDQLMSSAGYALGMRKTAR